MKIRSKCPGVMIVLIIALLWISTSQSSVAAREAAAEDASLPVDIILVIDNSLSMKSSDPQNLTPTVVANFINGLNSQSRIGMVVFSGTNDLTLSLTALSDQTNRTKAAAVLNKIDFKGQNTDIPAAIERALYELKQNGRSDAQKSIVFMTDGIVETGNQYNDQQRTQWLKEDLSGECQRLGIKIFGIAFTEQADFALIQTLGQKTGGGYYRVLKAEDIQGAFNSILTAMLSPNKSVAPPANPPASVPAAVQTGNLTWTLIVGGLLIIGAAVILMGRKGDSNQPSPDYAEVLPSVLIPPARLEDMNRITAQEAYAINKSVIRIGRKVAGKSNTTIDIAIPAPGVSAEHAIIEYRGSDFYVVDRRSTNGTYLNGQNLINMSVPGEAVLKSGDVVGFDNQEFRFVLEDKIGKGGETIAAPQYGGTVFRPGASPSTPVVTPDKPYQDKLTARINDEDEDGTLFATGKCANHPSFNADGFCYICQREFCEDCLGEHEGKPICKECHNKLG